MATKKYDDQRYAYTAGVGKMADDTVEISTPEHELRTSNVPDQKAMRFIHKNDKLSEFLNPKAGAGRGGQGGPTAKEFKEANMSAAEKNARQDILEEKYTRKTKDQDYAKGGKVSASSRADGIAQRGKTRGTIVACGGGMMRGKK